MCIPKSKSIYLSLDNMFALMDSPLLVKPENVLAHRRKEEEGGREGKEIAYHRVCVCVCVCVCV